MVTEEKELKSQIEQRVVDFTTKIDILTEELGISKFQVLFKFHLQNLRKVYSVSILCLFSSEEKDSCVVSVLSLL